MNPKKRHFNRNQKNFIRTNKKIRAREMLVIGADGEKIGVLKHHEAMEEAKKAGLDLVEISPNARPPVCKILDFGKYRYELAKKEKENKKHSQPNKVKELKFRMNIDGGDYATKLKRGEQFMFKGMKLKVMMMLRGREMQYKGRAMEVMKDIEKDLAHVGIADQRPKMVGRNINMMLTPLPENKRTRKFTDSGEIHEEDVEEDENDVSTSE